MSAGLEPRRHRLGNARPARDAIERVPAVVEQDAPACELRIDAPVRHARRTRGDRGLSSQRPPLDAAHDPDRAPVD